MPFMTTIIYLRTQALWSSPCFDALQEHRCRLRLNTVGVPHQDALVIRDPVTGPTSNFHGLRQVVALIASGTIGTLVLPDLEHLRACRNLDGTLPKRIRSNSVRVILADGGQIVIDEWNRLSLLPRTPACETARPNQAQPREALLRQAQERCGRIVQANARREGGCMN